MAGSENGVVIVSAARTPVGSFNGSLSSVPASYLGTVALKAAMARAKVEPGEVDEVILGQILTAAQGQNPARQAAINAGIPNESPAWGMNQLCGSGLRAVALGLQQIASGDARIVAAGGQESMSKAPHAAYLREGVKMGDWQFIDTMIKDGLWDAFNGYHMGTTAENVAKQWQITREQQDAFAVNSQNKAEAAQAAGKFKDEIAPVTIKTRKGDVVVSDDEYIKEGVTYDGISKLRPAFERDGTVTAANSSSISDGAAALILASARAADAAGLKARARILGHASHAQAPADFPTAPVPAARKLLDRLGWDHASVDLWEVNEAFAVVPMAFMREMGLDHARVNVNGGACALGHPIGASGARIVVTLLNALEKRGLKRGVAAICIGGGEGTAIAIERA